jgi:hypothetical protein
VSLDKRGLGSYGHFYRLAFHCEQRFSYLLLHHFSSVLYKLDEGGHAQEIRLQRICMSLGP